MIKKIFVCLTFLCGSLVGFADTRWSMAVFRVAVVNLLVTKTILR